MVLVHCTSSYCQKTCIPSLESFEPMVTKLCFRQELLYKINQRGTIQTGTMQSQSSCALHFESLPETCITSLESFEPMVTKLCSGQEMLYKINQRKVIQKRNKVELRFLCTALGACIPKLESFGPMMTKLRSGQGKQDDAATADQSNPNMLPSQAIQKVESLT